MVRHPGSIGAWVLLASVLLYGGPSRAQEPQWRVLPNAPMGPGRHEDLSFVDARRGWVVNLAGEIHQTTDGGATWRLQFMDDLVHFRSVGFADSLRGWAGTLMSADPLYETFDGGQSWSKVQNLPSPRPAGLCGISVVNDSVMYAGGTYDRTSPLLKTVDRGMSWTAIDVSAYAKTVIDCYFFAPDSGFVVGGYAQQSDPPLEDVRAVVLFTGDGGQTWQTRYRSSSQGTWCWKISFPTPSHGFISVESYSQPQGMVLKTTDGGLTWQEKGVPNETDLQGIGFATESLGWVGSHVGSYVTRDGGESWQEFDFWPDNDAVNRIRMLSDTLGYAVGKTVFKYSRQEMTAVSSRASRVPGFSLGQNYPNPFNSETVISYSIPKAEFVTLRIYDMLGREVVTLVDEFQEANVYSVPLDAGRLASGIYFYRLHLGGDLVETKKMINLR